MNDNIVSAQDSIDESDIHQKISLFDNSIYLATKLLAFVCGCLILAYYQTH